MFADPAPRLHNRFLGLASWALIAFVFVLPFAHTVALRSVLLLLCSLGALFVAAREGWRQGVLPFLLLAWAVWGLASLGWSVRPDYSAYQLTHELLPGLLAFYSAYVLIRTPAWWRRFVCAVVVSAGLYAAIGVVAGLRPGGFADRFLTDTGYGSTTLVLALPFFVVALRRNGASPALRSILLLGVALLFVAAYYSANRIFWVSAALALLVGLFFPRTGDAARRALSPGRIVLAFVAVALVAWLLVSISMLRGIVPNGAYDIGRVIFDDVRWGIWQTALDLIGKAPWLGYGYGRTIMNEALLTRHGIFVAHAHNIWLNQAISLGLPGLALFLLFSTGFAFAFWRAASGHASLAREVGLAGFLVCAVFLAKNLTDDFFVRHSGQLFLALTGAALGMLRSPRGEADGWA